MSVSIITVASDNMISVNKLVDTYEAEFDYITNDGSLFYFKTNLDAPLYVSRAYLWTYI